jgi:hypothetical protein
VSKAKRRRAPGETRLADRLPHFIFGRDKAIEEAYGFLLAGKLVTDIPQGEDLSEEDRHLFAEIVQALGRRAETDPHFDRANIWRGVKPPHRLKPPFSDAAVIARTKRCIVVGVRIDSRNDGFIRLDDSLLAEVMGRH